MQSKIVERLSAAANDVPNAFKRATANPADIKVAVRLDDLRAVIATLSSTNGDDGESLQWELQAVANGPSVPASIRDVAQRAANRITSLTTENAAVKEQLERMRKLLKPFAARAEEYDSPAEKRGVSSPYKDDREMRVSLGDCRKARAALNQDKPHG
jgi:hypothetical protein